MSGIRPTSRLSIYSFEQRHMDLAGLRCTASIISLSIAKNGLRSFTGLTPAAWQACPVNLSVIRRSGRRWCGSNAN